jgi:hypothetical protein
MLPNTNLVNLLNKSTSFRRDDEENSSEHNASMQRRKNHLEKKNAIKTGNDLTDWQISRASRDRCYDFLNIFAN